MNVADAVVTMLLGLSGIGLVGALAYARYHDTRLGPADEDADTS